MVHHPNDLTNTKLRSNHLRKPLADHPPRKGRLILARCHHLCTSGSTTRGSMGLRFSYLIWRMGCILMIGRWSINCRIRMSGALFLLRSNLIVKWLKWLRGIVLCRRYQSIYRKNRNYLSILKSTWIHLEKHNFLIYRYPNITSKYKNFHLIK